MNYKVTWGEGYSQEVKSKAEAIKILRELIVHYGEIKVQKIIKYAEQERR